MFCVLKLNPQHQAQSLQCQLMELMFLIVLLQLEKREHRKVLNGMVSFYFMMSMKLCKLEQFFFVMLQSLF